MPVSPFIKAPSLVMLFVGLVALGLGCDGLNGVLRGGATSLDASTPDMGAPDGPSIADAGSEKSAADAFVADISSVDVAPGDTLSADTLSPDATYDTQPVPTVPVLPHKTDFLNVGCRTHTYGGLGEAQRKACRNAVKQRGYTHFYLYAYNEKDYGGPRFDYFANPAGFAALLQELIDDGLAPVVWLFPDDAPTIHGVKIPALQAKISTLVPQIDHLVSSYCLGLELDEYWLGGKVDLLGAHLRALTSKQIAVHQVNGKWHYGKYAWVDYMILQYGFGKNASFIRQMTQQCKRELNKPVVAGEYALDDAPLGKKLGDAAVAAGAAGFGNGGTP